MPSPGSPSPFPHEHPRHTPSLPSLAPLPPPSSPRVVGDYALLSTLGSGSVGKVKLARHRTSGDLVAIKVIRKAFLEGHPALGLKVRREIAVLKLLGGAAKRYGRPTHATGVLGLLDVYETENCWLLILEYCEGGEMFDRVLEGGYMSERDCLRYFQELVLALWFSHKNGVTHRDLKLENVLLDGKGHLRLADFGMASLMMPGSMLETACGSPSYCAPEVLSGDLYDGVKSDCWSLGVILYVMATGGLPFDDDNFSRLVAKVQSGVFFVPEEVDGRLADVVRSLLRVNPEDRMTLDDVLAGDWFNSRPLPEHMAVLHHAVDDAREGRKRRVDVGGKADGEWHASPGVDYAPVPEPVMTVVVHLSELGLGEIPTLLRRLRSERQCLEKEYYNLIGAFVTEPTLPRAVKGEPLTPSGRGSPGKGAEMSPYVGKQDLLPVSLADDTSAVGITAALQATTLHR